MPDALARIGLRTIRKKALLASLIAFIMLMMASAAIVWQLGNHERKLAEQRIQWYMGNLAHTVSLLIDGDIHASFTRPEQEASPEYQAMKRKLEEAIDRTEHLRFIYTFIERDGNIYYIIDADSISTPHELPSAALMDLAEDLPGLMRQAATSDSVLVEEAVTDGEFGRLISAYAPIRDSSGKRVAAVGVDITDADYVYLTNLSSQQQRNTWLLSLGISLCSAFLVYITVSAFLHSQKQRARNRQSRERLEAAMQASPQGIYLLDAYFDSKGEVIDFVFRDVNKAGCTMVGMAREELLGHRLCELMPINREGGFFEKYKHVYLSGEHLEESFQIDVPYFKPRWAQISVVPLSTGVYISTTDITEKKQSEEELRTSARRLEATTANMPGMVYRFKRSPDGRYTFPYISSRVRDFGLTPEQVYSDVRALLGMVHEDDMARLNASIETSARHLTKWSQEFRIWVQKKEIWLDARSLPHRQEDGSIIWDGMMMDITELKVAQQMLEHTNEELRQNNTMLVDARAAAEQASAAKRDFLANVSHEIRTPLNGVLGTVELLSETKLDSKQKRLIEVLHQTGETLLVLINDILDFSKIESGNMQIHETVFDPQTLLEETMLLMSNSARQKGVKLEIEIPSPLPKAVLGDRERLRQILVNYTSNAIKFTERGTVRICAESKGTNEHGELLRFSVADEGIGIPAEKHEYIFNKFTQADSSTNRRYGGTGLGLAICRQLAELMDGEVGVNSEEGKGATFWYEGRFLLRDAVADGQSAKASAARIINQTGAQPLCKDKRVLLAEDNPVNQMVTRSLLEKMGMVVTLATDGEAALKGLQSAPIDLALLDIQMPNMSGLEVAKSQRLYEADNNLPRTPIVAFTANALESYRDDCLAAGMDDFLSKPLRKEMLIAVLGRFFGFNETRSPHEIQGRRHILSTGLLAELEVMMRGKMDELFSCFTEDTDERLQALADANEKADTKSVASIAHSIKSGAQNIGAERLYDLMASIEENADGSTTEDREEWIGQAQEEYAALKKAIAAYLAQVEA